MSCFFFHRWKELPAPVDYRRRHCRDCGQFQWRSALWWDYQRAGMSSGWHEGHAVISLPEAARRYAEARAAYDKRKADERQRRQAEYEASLKELPSSRVTGRLCQTRHPNVLVIDDEDDR